MIVEYITRSGIRNYTKLACTGLKKIKNDSLSANQTGDAAITASHPLDGASRAIEPDTSVIIILWTRSFEVQFCLLWHIGAASGAL